MEDPVQYTRFNFLSFRHISRENCTGLNYFELTLPRASPNTIQHIDNYADYIILRNEKFRDLFNSREQVIYQNLQLTVLTFFNVLEMNGILYFN